MRTDERILDTEDIRVSNPGHSLFKRISSNFIWSIIAEATPKGVFFITNVYLARILDASGYGVFALAQTVTYYFWFSVDLGVSMYGIREIARNRGNAGNIINSLLTMRITSGAIVFFMYTAVVSLIDMPSTHKLAFLGCGFYLTTYSLYSDWVFKGLEKFKYIAYGSFASSGVFLISVLVFIKDADDLAIAAFVWSVSFIFGSGSLLYVLFRKAGVRFKLDFDFRAWLYHIKESVYLSISSALLTVYRYLSILLLSYFYTTLEVGLFSAPYRVVLAVGTAGLMLPMAFFPAMSEIYIKDNGGFGKTHANLHKIMFAMGVPLAAAGTLFGENIVIALFGSQYEQSILAFKMLVWLIPLYFLRHSYGLVLIAAGFQRLHNLAVLSGVVCMSVTGLIMIPLWGIKGGALALVFSEMAILAVIVLFVRTRTERPPQRPNGTNEYSSDCRGYDG
jgi:O-antigen/teichoic acid export membrane protein